MSGTSNSQNVVPIFKILKWVVPFIMLAAAVTVYFVGSDDIKYLLAAVFACVAVADFLAFHLLIRKIEK